MNLPKTSQLPPPDSGPGHCHPLELRLVQVQRYGAILCVLLISSGIIGTVLTTPTGGPHPLSFTEMVRDVSSGAGELVFSNTSSFKLKFFHFKDLIIGGIVLLILLPVVRLMMTVVIFFFKKDFLYVFLSTLIFAVMFLGILFIKIR